MFNIGFIQAMKARFWNYAPPVAGITNSTADVVIKAAPAVATDCNCVSSLQISVSVALANVTTLVVKSGAATVLARFPINTAVQNPIPITLDPPLKGNPGEAINIAAETIFLTGNLLVNAQGYQV